MKKKESKISTMKKCAVLLASAMLLATGCGKGDEKTIDGSVQNIQPEELGSEASGSTSGTGQTGQAQGSGTGSAPAANGAASGEGYAFSYNGTVIEVDADAAPILAVLGDPVSISRPRAALSREWTKCPPITALNWTPTPTGAKTTSPQSS